LIILILSITFISLEKRLAHCIKMPYDVLGWQNQKVFKEKCSLFEVESL